jgi:phage terminase Nu1 subunit (DNA packaging protein)
VLFAGGMMAEKWFDALPDDALFTDDERIYIETHAKVKAGLANGLDFEKASARVDITDKELRETVLDEVLKAVIAEEHFARHIPLDQISRTLNLPLERIERAIKEMFEDVERSAVDSLHKNIDHGTEH